MELFNGGFNPPKDFIVAWSDNGWGEFDYLPKGRFTVIEDLTDLEGNHIAEVGDIVYTKFDEKPADTFLGTHLYKVINEDKQKELLVAEDHIERIKF